MSIEAYRKLVFDDYLRRRSDNTLSLKLIHPSLARLRDEFVRFCDTRYDQKDEKVLRDFFYELDFKNGDDLAKKIANGDIEKFKALLNYLKRRTTKPDINLTEILAWLIDFEPRPYEFGREYRNSETGKEASDENKTNTSGEVGIIEPAIGEEESEENSIIGDVRNKKEGGDNIEMLVEPFLKTSLSDAEIELDNCGKSSGNGYVEDSKIDVPVIINIKDAPGTPTIKHRKKRRVLIISIIVLFLLSGFGLIFKMLNKDKGDEEKGNILGAPPLGPQRCMYWAGEFYKEVDCNTKLRDTVIVAFDSAKFIGLRKITEPDTITQNAIGHVWYVKLKGTIEYYTGEGYHPVYTHLRLKPLTAYMINRHIAVKE